MEKHSHKIQMTIAVFAVLAIIIVLALAGKKNQQQPLLPEDTNDTTTMNEENTIDTTVILKTNDGDITLELYDTLAPETVANFIKLAKSDFYDGVRFHRVIDGFMIQSGDPLSKDESMRARWGTGDPGYKFADEIHKENNNNKGTIAMANSGPNTNGSQFFINVADNNFLDTKHTVFGRVVEGYDVVEMISKTPTGPNDQPIDDVIIEDIFIQE